MSVDLFASKQEVVHFVSPYIELVAHKELNAIREKNALYLNNVLAGAYEQCDDASKKILSAIFKQERPTMEGFATMADEFSGQERATLSSYFNKISQNSEHFVSLAFGHGNVCEIRTLIDKYASPVNTPALQAPVELVVREPQNIVLFNHSIAWQDEMPAAMHNLRGFNNSLLNSIYAISYAQLKPLHKRCLMGTPTNNFVELLEEAGPSQLPAIQALVKDMAHHLHGQFKDEFLKDNLKNLQAFVRLHTLEPMEFYVFNKAQQNNHLHQRVVEMLDAHTPVKVTGFVDYDEHDGHYNSPVTSTGKRVMQTLMKLRESFGPGPKISKNNMNS